MTWEIGDDGGESVVLADTDVDEAAWSLELARGSPVRVGVYNRPRFLRWVYMLVGCPRLITWGVQEVNKAINAARNDVLPRESLHTVS